MSNTFWTVGTLVFTLMLFNKVYSSKCGEYICLDSTAESGVISSPNYPNNYGNFEHCIWLIQAPTKARIFLNITQLSLEQAGDGSCLDYLQVRDGSSTETLRFEACVTTDNIMITSRNRWLWLQFKSNHRFAGTGFTAQFTTVATTLADEPNPWPDCQSVSFKCRNKECIEYAYRCDGQNDCGCTGGGCDEAGCDGLGWTATARLCVGVGVGVFTFTLLFVGIGVGEIFYKRRMDEINRKKEEELKQNAKKRNRRKPAADNKIQETTTGVKIDVPNGREATFTGPHTPASKTSSFSSFFK